MSATETSRRGRLGKVLYELFCMPVIIDCNCEECKPRGSPQLDSSSVSREPEMLVTVETSLVSLMEDATQDNVEMALPEEGIGRWIAKAVKNFFFMLVEIDSSGEECNPKESPEPDSQSASGESEGFVTVETSLVSLMEDATQDNVEMPLPKKGKWRRIAKAVKNFFCMPVIIDCSCEECNPKESPEPDSQSVSGESEGFVTAKTSLVSLMEDATQDNVEMALPEEGIGRWIAKAVKNFFFMLVEIDSSGEECNPKESPEPDSQSASGESEGFVTVETSLVSLMEDATQDNVEMALPKKGKWRRIAKAVKNFFCMPVVIDCSCEECKARFPEL